MSKKMLINATLPEEDRVAIVENGILTELDIEVADRQQTKSNIYKGEVIRVEQGLQAAFIDYGAQRAGFLQIGEIHPSLYPKRDDDSPHPRRPAINDILKKGQQILVQVVKEERGNKGAALTTEFSLPGRYMVLMPQSDSHGISRKIENDSVRKGIKQIMADLNLPENMGYIIRTAAIDQPAQELKRDFDYLFNTYNNIISHSEKTQAPTLIYQESNLVLRSIRDYFSPEIDEVLIDDRAVFQEAREFFKAVMPEYTSLVKLHQERRPIFSRYQIEEQIAALSSNTVNLPSGGSIVLDQTEALVAIDVNSGKMSSEQNVEATAHRVNVEAACEVARQLRLRDMGGLIVIDFIDMRQRKNAREVEKALKTGLKIDKARVTVGRISHQFGLLEMSRQRIKANLGEGTYQVCHHCQGNGHIQSAESRSVALLRRIQAGTAKGSIVQVICTVCVEVANYLLNNKRRELFELEQRYKLTITIHSNPQYLPEQVALDFIKQSKEQKEKQQNNDQTPLVETNVADRCQIEDTSTSESTENVEQKKPRRRRRPNHRRNNQKINENVSASKNNEGTPTETSEQPDTTTTPVQPKSVEETQKTSETAPQEKTTQAATETDNVAKTDEIDTEVKKPVQRRRSTAATKKAAQPTTAKKAASSTHESEVKSASAEKLAEESDTPMAQVEEKPKRRTPRRKTASKTKEEGTQNIVPKDGETTTTDDKDAKAVEEKKPARRRRTTKKTTEPAATKAATESAATESVMAETASNADKNKTSTAEEPAKPKRRTTRKTAPSTVEGVATTESADEVTKESPEVKKPVRRRRTTKKAVEATAQESATSNAGTDKKITDTAEKTSEEVKPKRKVARRKTTTKPEDAASSVDTNQKKTSSDEGTTIEKKVVKKTTKKADSEAEIAAETKKPVRRRRTTTKKVAEAQEKTTTVEKPKRRASSTKSKTTSKKATSTEDKPVDS
ncbi:MAG: Rne/Rng family ribonuclease [Thermodesulfobacteriota bacterium]|nr:Rne/Rng family ribonuclease [Thermodesulfobacteriota bacterium]